MKPVENESQLESVGTDTVSTGVPAKPNGARGGLRIERVPLTDLHADPANARTHGERNLDAIGDSLRSFGQVEPLVVQRGTGRVIGGNGRLAVMRREGITEAEVVYLDVDDQTATRLGIALNRTAELAEWDKETLASLLDGMGEADLLTTGFDGDELKDLLADLTPPEVVEDEAPAPLPDPVSKTGDLWEMGGHRLLCGDSTNEADVTLVLDGDPADTITDPPYGIGYEYASHQDTKEANGPLWDAVYKLAPGAKIWTPGLMNLGREMVKHPNARVLVWHKGFSQAGNGLGGASTWEPVVCVDVKGGRLPNDYLHFSTDREPGLRESHPCPKPVRLYAHLIEHLTGRAVYEPFSGSGTTIIAAEQLGRKCYAIEIEPRYVDVAIRRWEKLTGKQATLAGQTFAQIAAARGVAVV